jgi:hypothetical protein
MTPWHDWTGRGSDGRVGIAGGQGKSPGAWEVRCGVYVWVLCNVVVMCPRDSGLFPCFLSFSRKLRNQLPVRRLPPSVVAVRKRQNGGHKAVVMRGGRQPTPVSAPGNCLWVCHRDCQIHLREIPWCTSNRCTGINWRQIAGQDTCPWGVERQLSPRTGFFRNREDLWPARRSCGRRTLQMPWCDHIR